MHRHQLVAQVCTRPCMGHVKHQLTNRNATQGRACRHPLLRCIHTPRSESGCGTCFRSARGGCVVSVRWASEAINCSDIRNFRFLFNQSAVDCLVTVHIFTVCQFTLVAVLRPCTGTSLLKRSSLEDTMGLAATEAKSIVRVCRTGHWHMFR